MIWQIMQLQFMIEKPWPNILTLSTILYDFSVSRNLFSMAEMPQFGAAGTEGLKRFSDHYSHLLTYRCPAEFSRLVSCNVYTM